MLPDVEQSGERNDGEGDSRGTSPHQNGTSVMTELNRFTNVSRESCEAMRAMFINACDARLARERTFPEHSSIEKFLLRERKEWQTCDALTLAYAVATGVDPLAWYMHERHAGEMTNVYSIPKQRVFARVLSGGSFRDLLDSDEATCAGTVLSLQRGSRIGKQIAADLNDFMNSAAGRRGYASGATQSGSSLRALECLGIVKKASPREWEVIASKEDFDLLVKAARKAKRS
jgi:hypothetical protein